MRDVTMLVTRVVYVFHPLLQLSVLTYPHGRQLLNHLPKGVLERFRVTHNPRGTQRIGQSVEGQLVVHGAPRCHWAMFRGKRRSDYPLMILGMLYQEIKQEESCTLQGRIVVAQESLVSCIEIVLPQMLRQPRTS